jgi:hypothetical protein
MIIVDLNQVMISNLMVSMHGPGNSTIDVNEDLLRHMVLNSIRSYNKKFADEFGEMVIACDSWKYWRREYFPYYKASRKKNRESSGLDWNTIFQSLNKIRDELAEYFPYRNINVEGAEADDVIGTLCHTYGRELGGEPILIVSGDKDFQQLQIYSNVQQYDPVRKKYIKCKNPEEFLIEHIIRGDVGDGVPNFLSPDDVFVTNGRQKPIMAKKLATWMLSLKNNEAVTEVFDSEQSRNFSRNIMLIDLKQTPSDIKDAILESFLSQENKSRAKLFNYFVKFKLKNLMETIGEF